MLKSCCFAAAMIAAASVPAFAADDCGPAPIAPAIPPASDVAGKTPDDAHKVSLGALHDVKVYQAELLPFRNCLVKQADTDKAAIAEAQGKGDKSKVSSLQDQTQGLDKVYQDTITTETQVVDDYMALHDAYCKLGTNLTGCAAPAH